MRRWPVVPTMVVVLAVATMIGLGLWQLLDRRPRKLAYIAQIEANPAKPPIAFPAAPDDALLFRRSAGRCLEPRDIRVAGAGAAGFRVIADCRTGAEGPGMVVQLGTTRDPQAKPRWLGGEVRGHIAYAPSTISVLARLYDHRPDRLMLVAEPPLAGLAPNLRPDVSAVPNPHLSYAIQWFFFAGSAAVIYALALRRRRTD